MFLEIAVYSIFDALALDLDYEIELNEIELSTTTSASQQKRSVVIQGMHLASNSKFVSTDSFAISLVVKSTVDSW